MSRSNTGGYDMMWANGQMPPMYDLPFNDHEINSGATEGLVSHNPKQFDGITCNDN